MRYLKFIIVFAALLFAACGGSEEPKTPTEVYLNLGNSLEWNENSKFLIIQTDGQWSITLNYLGTATGWCTLSASTGTGDRNVAISTTTNNSSLSRSVEITVQTESKTVSVTLEQKGNTEEPPPAGDIDANINGLSEPISLAWNENTFTLNIVCESSVAWDIATGDATWLSGVGNLYGNGTRSIVFNISQNAIRDNRDATITIASSTGVVNLNFTQRGRRFELPKIEKPQWFREYYGEISLEYSIAQKHAKWVAWPLHKGYLGSGRTDAWKFDRTLDPYNPVYGSTGQPNDYRNQINLLDMTSTITYNRGHLCPSADRNANTQLNSATFWYSNMSPQIGDFNGGIWGRLETTVRKWAEIPNDTLYICAGGSVLRDDHIALHTNPSSMAVPKYYFKVILRKRGNDTYNAIGFWFEHRKYLDNNGKTTNTLVDRLDEVMMSVEEIEALTGINFFSDLPIEIQDVVEAQKNKNDWTW